MNALILFERNVVEKKCRTRKNSSLNLPRRQAVIHIQHSTHCYQTETVRQTTLLSRDSSCTSFHFHKDIDHYGLAFFLHGSVPA